MKLKLAGSLSRNDVVVDASISEWHQMWLDLSVEYWQCLYDSIPHTHTAKHLYGRQLIEVKRKQQAYKIYNSYVGR